MASSLTKQALTLTLANAYTRALGFVLRLLSARLMGAEAMGVMELSSSAIMLAITPATAGIPTAMSRLTAQPGADAKAVLRAGLSLVKRLSLMLIPAMLLLSPAMAWLLGDWRTLPSILTSAPAIRFAWHRRLTPCREEQQNPIRLYLLLGIRNRNLFKTEKVRENGHHSSNRIFWRKVRLMMMTG